MVAHEGIEAVQRRISPKRRMTTVRTSVSVRTRKRLGLALTKLVSKTQVYTILTRGQGAGTDSQSEGGEKEKWTRPGSNRTPLAYKLLSERDNQLHHVP